jgi:signal transduction histidine kinase/ActR/RegA family two-component response regulator
VGEASVLTRLGGLTISWKLTLIVALTALVALLLAGGALIVDDLVTFRARMARDLSVTADIIGANSTAALAFNDATAAGEVLAALRVEPQIVVAQVHDRTGRVFATYRRLGAPDTAPGSPGPGGSRFTRDRLIVVRALVLDGEPLGTVRLEADLQELDARRNRQAVRVLLVALCAAGVALLLAIPLQRRITGPILRLAETARAVSAGKDYTVRAGGGGADEVGQLVRGFNEMLGQIQARDDALRSHRDHLEEEVATRTAALARGQEELRQAQKMEAVGRLAGGVAHDFNNLLTIVLGRSELLLKRLSATDPLRRQVEMIRKTTERAADLTRQLLAFSRKQVLEARVLSINGVVTGMEKMLRLMVTENVRLIVKLDAALEQVKVDPGQLEQVIMNLAVNARDAMPTGGALTLETANAELDLAFARDHPGSRPGPHVMLRMSDTGMGMDAETRAHLFEPFFTTKGPGRGTGLGLATVFGIVKQSGGYIDVQSAPGQGATFTIYLPKTEESMPEADAAATAAATPGAQGETVLVVEDEDDVRELACEILSLCTYTVLEARHPGEALLITERHRGPIHLMVTDVVMPQMKGTELARLVTAFRPEMRVLYMSGYAAGILGDADGVLESHMSFLPKPFSRDTLVRKVREVLDAPRADDHLVKSSVSA